MLLVGSCMPQQIQTHTHAELELKMAKHENNPTLSDTQSNNFAINQGTKRNERPTTNYQQKHTKITKLF